MNYPIIMPPKNRRRRRSLSTRGIVFICSFALVASVIVFFVLI